MDSPNIQQAFVSSVAFAASRIQAGAIYCSDGRYGEQMDDFLHHALRLPRYDRLALPGGAACLAGHVRGYHERDALVEELRFLLAVHQLGRLVLIAHSDCAYYTEWLRVAPAGLETRQIDDLAAAAARIRRLDRNLAVETFFARRQGERVQFEAVGQVAVAK